MSEAITITIDTSAMPKRHLPGLNEYTEACRAHRMKGANMKRAAEDAVMWQLPNVRMDDPCEARFEWYEPTARRDIDNISHGCKYVLDALVKKGVLHDDDQRHVKRIRHEFHHDSKHPRVVVTLTPVVV